MAHFPTEREYAPHKKGVSNNLHHILLFKFVHSFIMSIYYEYFS